MGMYEDYYDLVKDKGYLDMSEDEVEFCIQTELNIYLPKIEKLKAKGFDDKFITFCLFDLFMGDIICDYTVFFKEMNISDSIIHKVVNDWCDNKCYYTKGNPLIVDN